MGHGRRVVAPGRRAARRRGARGPAALGALFVVALLAGCGSYTDPSPSTPTAADDSASTGSSGTPSPTSETVPGPTAEPTATPPSEDELPGEAVEGYPEAETELTVVGVPAVEELNVRLGPGTGYDVVDRLPPDGEVRATGRVRMLPDDEGLWYEIGDDDGALGWVSAGFLAELGVTRDVTDAFDPLPAAGTVNELVVAVVAGWRDGATGPDGVLVRGPVTTTSMQMSVDLLDGDDDSVRGVRLLVTSDRGDGGYRVSRVSLTQICARGASAGGCT